MSEVTVKADPLPEEAMHIALPSLEYYVIKTYLDNDNKTVLTAILDGPMTKEEALSIRDLRAKANPLNAAYNIAFREISND